MFDFVGGRKKRKRSHSPAISEGSNVSRDGISEDTESSSSAAAAAAGAAAARGIPQCTCVESGFPWILVNRG